MNINGLRNELTASMDKLFGSQGFEKQPSRESWLITYTKENVSLTIFPDSHYSIESSGHEYNGSSITFSLRGSVADSLENRQYQKELRQIQREFNSGNSGSMEISDLCFEELGEKRGSKRSRMVVRYPAKMERDTVAAKIYDLQLGLTDL